MNDQRFYQARNAVLNQETIRDSIGLLQEKTLHAVLKYYYEPHPENHEIKIGSYIADIVGENGIIEIQTQGFDKLRKKLAAFLEVCPVTVVYPVAGIKWLSWIDEETGQASDLRKSPKRGTVYEAFWELQKILSLLSNERLTVCIVVLELEEYRLLNGWSQDRKKGSVRHNRIPLKILEEWRLERFEDYLRLIPDHLQEPFTLREFQKAIGIPQKRAQCVLRVLREMGAANYCGKQGRAYLYQRGKGKEV